MAHMLLLLLLRWTPLVSHGGRGTWRPFQHGGPGGQDSDGAPARRTKPACCSSTGGDGGVGESWAAPFGCGEHLGSDEGGHVLLTVRGVFAVKPLWDPGGVAGQGDERGHVCLERPRTY